MTGLPSAEQLQRLPLRAVVIYAVRSARRVLPALPANMDDCVVEEALMLAEAVTSTESLQRLDPSPIHLATARVLEAFLVQKELEERRPGEIRAVLSINSATRAAAAVLSAACESDRPDRVARHAAYVARAAEATAGRVDILGETMAAAANVAAARDYEILLKTFGEHEPSVIGDPIDFSVDSLLGTLT